MTYRIKRQGPNNGYYLPSEFDTLADAQIFLAGVRTRYAEDAPKGEKHLNHWHKDRLSIAVREGGDRITYEIIKQERR